MRKSKLGLLPVFLVALFLSTEIMAQGGRGRRGNQSNASKAQRGKRGQNSQTQQGNQKGSQNRNQTSPQNNRGVELSEIEIQGLILMREEEKLARDVYAAMQAKWNEGVFANISRAESKHMSAIGNLLSRYGIPDPVKNNARGVFTAQQFQQLYKALVEKGLKSREDALKVGLKIEEMDIADLRIAIQSTKNQDVSRVLENLLRGSRNHLRAFSSRLDSVGGNYAPTHLPQKDFDQISNSKPENGRSNGQQNGRGKIQKGSSQKGKGNGGLGQQGRGQTKGKGKGRGNGNGNGNEP